MSDLVCVTSDVLLRVFGLLTDFVCSDDIDFDADSPLPVTVTNGVGDRESFSDRLVIDRVREDVISLLTESVDVLEIVAVCERVWVPWLRVHDLSIV